MYLVTIFTYFNITKTKNNVELYPFITGEHQYDEDRCDQV